MNVISDLPLKVKFSVKFCFDGAFGRTQKVKAE